MGHEQAQDLPEALGYFFDLSSNLLGISDLDRRYKAVNKAWKERLGYALEDLRTHPYTDLIHEEDREAALPDLNAKDRTQVVEVRLRDKEGRFLWLEWSTIVLSDRDELCTVGRDISERKNIEAKLQESEDRYRELFENADDVICTADLDGNFTSLNRAAERISGYSRTEVIGLPFSRFVAPEYRPLLKQMTALKLAGQESTVFEIELLTKEGDRIPMELNTRLKFANGKPVAIQGIARDVSDRKRLADELRRRNEALEEANATIRRLMNQDSLTKLANRRSLEGTLDKAMSFAGRTEQPLSLILCDIDRFKAINDNLGHVAGDEVLASFGSLLAESCRREDTAARFGGEEFVLLLPNTDRDAALDIAERIRGNVEQAELASGARITASFGVSECISDDTSESFIARGRSPLFREGRREEPGAGSLSTRIHKYNDV